MRLLPGRPVVVCLALILAATALPGCLDDAEEPDLSAWHVGLSIEKFDTNGVRAINQTYFSLDVRFGPLYRSEWFVTESNGFTKGKESEFPWRVEARYRNGTALEPFPIQGGSTNSTGLLRIGGGTLKVIVDGDPASYAVGKEYETQPHDYEASARLKGPYGDMVLYFIMLEPRD